MQFKLPDELTRNILFWIQEKRWLLIIVLLGTLMYHLPYPTGIPHEGYRTLILCLIVISLIITEQVTLPAVVTNLDNHGNLLLLHHPVVRGDQLSVRVATSIG